MKKRNLIADIVLLLIAVVFAVLYMLPIYFSFISAFKTNGQILKDALSFPTSLYLDNFKYLFAHTKIVQAAMNSAFLTAVSLVLEIIVIPMAAYAIERRNNKVFNAIYMYFLMGMMIPFQAFMIPLFKQLKAMGLYGNFAGPIVIYVSGSVSFGVLLFVSFLKGVPREIEEAAGIDGSSRLGIFWRIVFPLLGPCTASMVVLNGIGIWNDFLMPMLVLPSEKPKTINVEIFYFIGQYTSQWNILFAGTVCAIIPLLVIFIALQKYFVKGIASGATKG
jgi:raffinose/stachyose/melibiose transport system permease protein